MNASPGQGWATDAVALTAHGAVYIEVPKVACSSIKIALAGLLGVDLEAAGGNPHTARFPEPSAPGEGPKLYPGIFSFAFVRNPWDRLVSCYRDKILGEVPDFTFLHPTRGVGHCLAHFSVFRADMSFDDFVDAVAEISDEEADVHFRSQHTFIVNRDGNIGVDFVGRFETLGRDFELVCEKLGIPSLILPRVQSVKTPRRYAEYYSRRSRDIVSDRFREDIVLLGYDFEAE